MTKPPRKKQDDRYLKKLRRAERTQQEALRKLIMNDQILAKS